MNDVPSEPASNEQNEPGGAPPPASTPSVFTILACVAAAMCLVTPRISLMMPVMASVGYGAAAWFKRKRRLSLALIAATCAIGLFALSEYRLSAPRSFNLSAAEVASLTWRVAPTYGGTGTVKWTVEVQSLSNRPIASARVDFETRDAAGNLLASTFTFVDAIPPGGKASAESYAGYYGLEATAGGRIAEVRFSEY